MAVRAFREKVESAIRCTTCGNGLRRNVDRAEFPRFYGCPRCPRPKSQPLAARRR